MYQRYINNLGYAIPTPLAEKVVDIVFIVDRSYVTDEAFDGAVCNFFHFYEFTD